MLNQNRIFLHRERCLTLKELISLSGHLSFPQIESAVPWRWWKQLLWNVCVYLRSIKFLCTWANKMIRHCRYRSAARFMAQTESCLSRGSLCKTTFRTAVIIICHVENMSLHMLCTQIQSAGLVSMLSLTLVSLLHLFYAPKLILVLQLSACGGHEWGGSL
jgi:hypothetical protein